MRLERLIVIAVCVGALLSLMGAGSRGFHFLPTFILVSGFVLGVGLLINHLAERLRSS